MTLAAFMRGWLGGGASLSLGQLRGLPRSPDRRKQAVCSSMLLRFADTQLVQLY